jgi:hypothetical protein
MLRKPAMAKSAFRRPILVVAVLLAASACARGIGVHDVPKQPEGSLPALPGPPAINWDNPIEGVAVDSVAGAQAMVHFKVISPEGLGVPIGIYVTNPEAAQVNDRVVAFVYQTDFYGLVDVQEHIPDMGVDGYQADLERLAGLSGSPGVRGSGELAQIRNGTTALITTAEGGGLSDIRWLQDQSIEVLVRGPNLDAAQVEEIANKV